MPDSRRRIILQWSAAGAALAATGRAAAQAAVDPKDPAAVSLGYVTDATKVDKAKFAKYQAGQHCGGCQLFQGAAGAATGACPIFAGKQVASAGWCSAWVKKAA